MKILLDNLSKKFYREWIFRNVSYQFEKSHTYAITGLNGSGKSTLLQLIAGNLLPTKGEISYFLNGNEIKGEDIYQYLSLVAPALELPEEFTLKEFLKFHFQFKKLRKGVSVDDLPSIFRLESAKEKFIKNFSTGMKQRIKLGIAFYADSPLLLLDEPATNLDIDGFNWYLSEAKQNIENRVIIICSNRKEEYDFCENHIDIMKYKN